MKRIILCGFNGVMGKKIQELVAYHDDYVIVAGVDLNSSSSKIPVYKNINDCQDEADVIINFSNPSSVKSVVEYALKNHLALVEATTGLSEEDKTYLVDAAKKIPLLQSGNTSLGLNLMICLAQQVAAVVGTNWEYEIIEEHHRRKIDAPSGAALMIANGINETLNQQLSYVYDRSSKRSARDNHELGISSIRGGNIVGTHKVKIISDNEILEITHTALDRNLFAEGSLKAAEFILNNKPGKLYSMEDVINLKKSV